MAWLYVPASADSNSGSSESGQTCEQSAGLRETVMQLLLSRKGKWTDFWLLLLSGMTSQHSTPALGVEQWISFLRASHASHGASPGSGEESETTDGSGSTLRTSFATWDPSGSCWRTCQGSLLEEERPEFSDRWPKSGSMRNGAASQRPKSARRTSVSGGSAWPTPDAQLFQDGADPEKHEARLQRLKQQCAGRNGNGAGTPLAMAAKQWPTPQAHDATGGKTSEQVERMRANGHGVSNLNEAAENWPTPTSRSAEDCPSERERNTPSLESQAVCATPTAHERTHSPRQVDHGEQLANQAASNDLTRQAKTTQTRGSDSSQKTRRLPRLLRAVLNPTFVEWLMGFPRDWSDVCAESVCDASAMQSSQHRPPARCAS